MRAKSTYHNLTMHPRIRNQRGMTLLEVLLSAVVLGIALTGFLMALATATTTSKMATDENQLVYLAGLEFESLRAAEYGKIPFLQTSAIGHVEQVPDYFTDIAISNAHGGDCQIVSSGDISNYTPDLAFDGKRANENSRWMGAVSEVAYVHGTGPSGGGPGGGGPGGGGPGGGPGGGGDFAPANYQYIYCSFPKSNNPSGLTKISRILFDNRFNVTEATSTVPGDLDYVSHLKGVWERNFDFFSSQKVLGFGELYDPWADPPDPLQFFRDEGYGSTGINVVFDNASAPLTVGIIGLHNVDTYADFDPNFHYPYASEIEAYGFSSATAFTESAASTEFNNVIMYFPNYLNSGFDMGRRSYVTAPTLDEARIGHADLMHVVIEFYPQSAAHSDTTWQKETWWSRDTQELAKFETSFYRDIPTRVDTLPNLHDYPQHQVYGSNEDLTFPFTVPYATSIRAHFNVFDLEPSPGTDEVTIEDPAGVVYGIVAYGSDLLNKYTEWVPGDTIVIHFKSNASLDSYDAFYKGFAVDSIEVKNVVPPK